MSRKHFIAFNLYWLVVTGTVSIALTSVYAATDEIDVFYRTEKINSRMPASTSREKEMQALEPNREPAAAKSAQGRRSKLPAEVVDGFELRVRYQKVTSAFWVTRRADKFQLDFVNSGDSRATLTLSADIFRQLHSVAERIKPAEHSLAKCKEASAQLHVLSAGRPERTLTTCLQAKGEDTEILRQLSQSLALMVK